MSNIDSEMSICDHMVPTYKCKEGCAGKVVPIRSDSDAVSGAAVPSKPAARMREVSRDFDHLFAIVESTVEQKVAIRDRVATWVADVDSSLRRVGEYKNEIGTEVSKIRAVELEFGKKIDAFIESVEEPINQLGERLELLHHGLIRTEARLTSMWNTLNTTIELQVELMSEFLGMSREGYQQRMLECGKRLFEEAASHQRNELNRMRDEQRAGKKPEPMRMAARPTVATLVVNDLADRAEAFRAEVDAIEQQDAEQEEKN
jgi:hypothetical protein